MQRLDAVSAAAFPVAMETAATDELSQRILDSYRAFQRSVRDYHAITEQSYLDTREAVDR